MPTPRPDAHVWITRSRDIRLSAIIHNPGARKLVILCHGFTGDKQEPARLFVTTARALAAAGFSALRFDFMGSGDSSGEFCDMSPNTEIADLKAVLTWARRRYPHIGVLGLSMGGAVSICTLAQLGDSAGVDALLTWSSVPGFGFWNSPPVKPITPADVNPTTVGPGFYTDRPECEVPESYCSLDMPKLQIQGDQDLPGFREEFARFFPKAPGTKKHVVIPGADHVFSTWKHRERVIGLSVEWFRRYVG